MTEPAEPIRSLPLRYRVDVLTTDQVARIRDAALAILDRTGFATSSPALLDRMAEHGQRVDAGARRIRLDPAFVERHPFPGPGLAVRILGEVTAARVAVLQEADAIFIGELRAAGWYERVAQLRSRFCSPCAASG